MALARDREGASVATPNEMVILSFAAAFWYLSRYGASRCSVSDRLRTIST
jgi:hypothetical protein